MEKKAENFEKMTLVIVGILVAAFIITVALGVVLLTTPKHEIQCLVGFGIIMCSALGLFIYWHRAYKRFNDLEDDEDDTVDASYEEV